MYDYNKRSVASSSSSVASSTLLSLSSSSTSIFQLLTTIAMKISTIKQPTRKFVLSASAASTTAADSAATTMNIERSKCSGMNMNSLKISSITATTNATRNAATTTTTMTPTVTPSTPSITIKKLSKAATSTTASTATTTTKTSKSKIATTTKKLSTASSTLNFNNTLFYNSKKLLWFVLLFGFITVHVNALNEETSSLTSSSLTAAVLSGNINSRRDIYIDDEEDIEGSGRGGPHDDLEKDHEFSGSGFGPDDEDSDDEYNHRRQHTHTQQTDNKNNNNINNNNNNSKNSSSHSISDSDSVNVSGINGSTNNKDNDNDYDNGNTGHGSQPSTIHKDNKHDDDDFGIIDNDDRVTKIEQEANGNVHDHIDTENDYEDEDVDEDDEGDNEDEDVDDEDEDIDNEDDNVDNVNNNDNDNNNDNHNGNGNTNDNHNKNDDFNDNDDDDDDDDDEDDGDVLPGSGHYGDNEDDDEVPFKTHHRNNEEQPRHETSTKLDDQYDRRHAEIQPDYNDNNFDFYVDQPIEHKNTKSDQIDDEKHSKETILGNGDTDDNADSDRVAESENDNDDNDGDDDDGDGDDVDDHDEIYTDISDPNFTSTTSITHKRPGGGVTNQGNLNNQNSNIHELDTNSINSLLPEATNTDKTVGNEVLIMNASSDDRTASFFAQPGILAAVIGGSVVGLLFAILIVMFIVYRMRKKDEGSYALDEPKRSPAVNSYAKNATNREFYA